MRNLFLAQVAQDFADDLIVMQVDPAAWHRAKDLQVPEKIRLILQPAYRPEVNPVEQLWEELREKYLHNRVFPSLEELLEGLCLALSELTEDKERLRSMMVFPHFRLECEIATWYEHRADRLAGRCADLTGFEPA